jgi:hypothetical protein
MKEMRYILITVLLFVYSSCNNKNTYKSDDFKYYPDSTYFDSNRTFRFDLNNEINYKKITDFIDIIHENDLIPYFEVKVGENTSKIIIFRNDHSSIKLRNKIIIKEDSVHINKSFPIKDLKDILKKSIKNNGKDVTLPENPGKIFIEIELDTSKSSENLEKTLKSILKGYNQLNQTDLDSFKLKIGLSYKIKIPIPPPFPYEQF